MPETPRIVLHNSDTAPLAQALRSSFPAVACRECQTYEDLPALIAEFRPDVVYSVRFAGTPGFPRDALFGRQGPRWVANGGAGTDHYGQWDPATTTVTNTAGVAADMMAEYVFGGFLHFTLDIPGLQQDKSARQWMARRVAPLSGKTLAIIGLGHTGQAVAKRAKAFGMRVIGTRAHPQPMQHVDEVHAANELQSVLSGADFIAVSTPLTAATRGLIGVEEVERMKPGVILADVSRGGVVDQVALLDALQTGHVAAAALDVFETEPLPQNNPLWGLDNVIISPHCSSVFEGWEQASFQLFLNNLRRWIGNEALTNVVDPKLGY